MGVRKLRMAAPVHICGACLEVIEREKGKLP